MGMFDIMPMLGVFFVLIIIVVLVFAIVKLKTVQMQTISQKSFNDFAEELRNDQRDIKASLNAISTKVAAMEKMMKDVQ